MLVTQQTKHWEKTLHAEGSHWMYFAMLKLTTARDAGFDKLAKTAQ